MPLLVNKTATLVLFESKKMPKLMWLLLISLDWKIQLMSMLVLLLILKKSDGMNVSIVKVAGGM